MDLPAAEGIAALYVLADDWMWRRDLLALLGAKDPARLDTLLAEMAPARSRRLQVVATGGEVA